MADQIILVDTSILIDYYRKTDKLNSVWVKLVKQGYGFVISAVTYNYSLSTLNRKHFDRIDSLNIIK